MTPDTSPACSCHSASSPPEAQGSLWHHLGAVTWLCDPGQQEPVVAGTDQAVPQKGGCALLKPSPPPSFPEKPHYSTWEAEIYVCLVPRGQNFPKKPGLASLGEQGLHFRTPHCPKAIFKAEPFPWQVSLWYPNSFLIKGITLLLAPRTGRTTFQISAGTETTTFSLFFL